MIIATCNFTDMQHKKICPNTYFTSNTWHSICSHTHNIEHKILLQSPVSAWKFQSLCCNDWHRNISRLLPFTWRRCCGENAICGFPSRRKCAGVLCARPHVRLFRLRRLRHCHAQVPTRPHWRAQGPLRLHWKAAQSFAKTLDWRWRPHRSLRPTSRTHPKLVPNCTEKEQRLIVFRLREDDYSFPNFLFPKICAIVCAHIPQNVKTSRGLGYIFYWLLII